MERLLDALTSVEIEPIAIVDIVLTALLFYWLFSLIRGTRAVRLVIGVISLYVVYAAAQLFGLQLLSQILQTGAVVGLLALVVVFQPELRRALERIGRFGSLGWLWSGSQGEVHRVADVVAHAAAQLSADRVGALIVLERETGLEDMAEGGVMLHAELSSELLRTIFTPRSALHDGAVLVRGDKLVAAGIVLPLAETSIQSERLGTRHRAALGITEQTDAVVVVVSEESGIIALVERARIVRHLDEDRLRSALASLMQPSAVRSRTARAGASPAVRGIRSLRPPRRASVDAEATGPTVAGPATEAPVAMAAEGGKQGS
jgi:diadenylate cyclase